SPLGRRMSSHTNTSRTSPVAMASPRSGLVPGLALSTLLALLAWQLGRWVPIVGGPVFGIVLGVAVRNIAGVPAACTPGIKFTGKKVLQWSIIALGFGLSLAQVAHTGLSSLA